MTTNGKIIEKVITSQSQCFSIVYESTTIYGSKVTLVLVKYLKDYLSIFYKISHKHVNIDQMQIRST